MRDVRLATAVVGVILWLPGQHLRAQGDASAHAMGSEVAVAQAVRAVPDPPRVDGVLDDPVWASAPAQGGFLQRDPDEGAPASERTEFRVLYTDAALFVAVRAFDSEPNRIAALLTRRDEWSPSDEVTVLIDSYRDRRTAFSFSVNAGGVKRDAYLFDDGDEDDRWDAVWDVGTRIDNEGWTAEFRIPFSQLRFATANDRVFGFNVVRRINRLNETQHWRLIPRDASGFVSRFGDLAGMRGIESPRRLEVLPYVVARDQRETAVQDNPFRDGVNMTVTGGADLKYGVTSWLTLTATVNPDFGQVEADPAVVNLSAFETFFTERRPFFTEGLDIFRFGVTDGDGDGAGEQLFYSRRIGRAPQGQPDARTGHAEEVEQTTIITAGKLSGKTKGWTGGLLGALTDEEHAAVVAADGRRFADAVEPRTGYLVGRLARDFRDGHTVIGLFGTAVQRALPERLEFLHARAYTGGFNWSHRFLNNTYRFSGRIAGSAVSGSPEAIARTQRASARYFQRPDNDYVRFDSTRTALTGTQVAMNFGKTAGNWRWSTGFDTRSPGFEVNDVGFLREADQISQFVWLNRRWLEPGRVFRRFNVNLNQWQTWTRGWDRRSLGGNVNANYMLWNYWNGWFGLNRNWRALSTTQLRGGPAIERPGAWNGWFGFASDGRKTFRGGASGWVWVQDETETWGAGVGVNASWRPRSNVDLTLSPGMDWNRDEAQYLDTQTVGGQPEYLFGSLEQTTASLTLRTNLTFSPTLSLQLYSQPFVSTGRYIGFSRIVAPRARPFRAQFETLTPDANADAGDVQFDLDRDGSPDLELDNPDFTVLSFRSNVVLRWEYKLGSTFFLVWQHGRNGFSNDGSFDLGPNVKDLFTADAENVLLVKVNYWISK